jgi:tRNA A-37 threonylcarbamoyl transferase component Bud32
MTGSNCPKPLTRAQLIERGLLRYEQRGVWRWYVRGDAQGDLSPWLDDLDRAFDAQTTGIERLKTHKVTDVARAIGSPSLVLKRYNRGKWYAPVADVFRATRAQRAFCLGVALERACIPTARVEAFAVHSTMGLPLRSCLVMRHMDMSMTLTRLMRDGAERDVQAALERAAQIVATLHQLGFAHRDLKSQNILVHAAAPTDLTLIDLDGVRYVGAVRVARRAKNLARLRQDVLAYGDGHARWAWLMRQYESVSGCRKMTLPTFRKPRR